MLVLGFKVQEASDEKETRFKVYALNKELVRLFEEKHGSIICKDLLGRTWAPRREETKRSRTTSFAPCAPVLSGTQPRSWLS